MVEIQKVQEFNEITSDNKKDVNDFLSQIGTRVISVTPIYNTILGGIMYVVVYWDIR